MKAEPKLVDDDEESIRGAVQRNKVGGEPQFQSANRSGLFPRDESYGELFALASGET